MGGTGLDPTEGWCENLEKARALNTYPILSMVHLLNSGAPKEAREGLLRQTEIVIIRDKVLLEAYLNPLLVFSSVFAKLRYYVGQEDRQQSLKSLQSRQYFKS